MISKMAPFDRPYITSVALLIGTLTDLEERPSSQYIDYNFLSCWANAT